MSHHQLLSSNIILYCRAWTETVRFYREDLRLPVCFENGWFVEFSLTQSSRLSIADERRASIKSCGGAGFTLTLQVDDIERAWQSLRSAGLEPTNIHDHPWDARVFHLFDPEGHRVEMWQPVSEEFSRGEGG